MPTTWDQEPLSYPPKGTTARAKWDAEVWGPASSRTVRVGVVGDSQETYTTSGDAYFYWLNALTAAVFGGMPETPWYGPIFSGHGTPGAFMVGQQAADLVYAIGTGGLTQAMFPPRIKPVLHDSITRGALYMLLHNNATGDREYGLCYSNLFDPAASLALDVIGVRQNVDSGQVRMAYAPQNAEQTAYITPISNTDSSDPVIATAGTPECRLVRFTGFNRGGLNYHQCYVKGTGASGTKTAIAAAKYVNLDNPAGVVFSPFSEPGYKASDWLTTHASANTFLSQCGIDVWMIGFGVNDLLIGGQSLATFKANILSLMSILQLASPNSRFVLRVDPYAYVASGPNWTNYDQCAGMFREIADSDSRVLVLNTRKAAHMFGQNEYNESTAGTTDRGVWAPSTVYNAGDVTTPTANSRFTKLYVCTAGHTSGASWSVDGPGASTANAHQRWRQLRFWGKSYTDSVHHNIDGGQRTLATLDVLGLFGNSGVRACLASSGLIG